MVGLSREKILQFMPNVSAKAKWITMDAKTFCLKLQRPRISITALLLRRFKKGMPDTGAGDVERQKSTQHTMSSSSALLSFEALEKTACSSISEEEKGRGVHWVTLPHEEIPIRVRSR